MGGEKGERGVEVREMGMEGERNENEREGEGEDEGEGRNINKDEMDNTQNNNNNKSSSSTIPCSNTHSMMATEKSSVKNGNTNSVNSSADSGSCIPESEDFVVPPIGRI